eukprot:2979160-Pleurochrysis_carterae.AAC.1
MKTLKFRRLQQRILRKESGRGLRGLSERNPGRMLQGVSIKRSPRSGILERTKSTPERKI